jgi:hypothetical protein
MAGNSASGVASQRPDDRARLAMHEGECLPVMVADDEATRSLRRSMAGGTGYLL